MKKFLLLILSVASALLLLASCGNGEDNQKPDSGSIIWGQDIQNVIVFDGGGSRAETLSSYIGSLTGKYPTLQGSDSEVQANEIVIGETQRPISVAAYKRLDRYADILSLSSMGESAWLIYAEGGSLAIAYSDIFARDAAFEYVYSNLNSETYSADGIVAKNRFNTESFIAAKREESREAGFASLELTFGEAAVASIRKIYSLYTEDLYIWLANLYDPDLGGFYYSASARNNEGFLPDLESTGQALELLVNSGLADGYEKKWTNMLSEKTKSELLAFARDMQDEDDGYFYHPQWGKGINSSRRGRDAGWARDIIEGLGEEPYYKYASDRDVQSAAHRLTDRLGKSSVSAVSSVVPTASAELASEESFRAWLDSQKISEDSYSTFNNLNSRISEIQKAGLWGFLLDYLREKQYDNGLWEPTVCYNSINGLMKISTFFGRSFPNVEAALDSTLEIMSRGVSEDLEGIVFVYNPWVCVANLIDSCSVTAAAKYNRILIERSEALFEGTLNKLAAFRKDDGGFSYHMDKTTATSQEALVAVEGSVESDVNSTAIAISTVLKYMFNAYAVYGITPPKFFSEYDALYFLGTLEGLGAIVKDVSDIEPEVITFDDYMNDGSEDGGVVISPAEYVTNKIGDMDRDESGYAWFTSSVVDNPDPKAYNGDKVLYVADKVYPDSEKSVADEQSSTSIKIANYTTVGNCYIFDADILFAGASDMKNPAMQIILSDGGKNNSVWLNLYPYERNGEQYLRIADEWEGADGVEDTAAVSKIPADEWFNLRIETYKDSDASGVVQFRIKIYLNGELAGVSDSAHYSNGAYSSFVINTVKLTYYRHSASAFYLDNLYAAKQIKKYESETVTAGEVGPLHYDFEDELLTEELYGYTYSTKSDEDGRVTYMQTSADGRGMEDGRYGLYFSLANDPDRQNNRVLKLESNDARGATAGSLAVYPTVATEGGWIHVVEYDYYVESSQTLKSSLLQLRFSDSAGTKIGGDITAAYSVSVPNATLKRDVFQMGSTVSGTDKVNNLFDARSWYKIRICWDQENGMLYYFYSADGGVSWYTAFEPTEKKSTAKVAMAELICNTYLNSGVQYLDNVSYTVQSELPTALLGMPESEIVPDKYTMVNIYDFETDVTEGISVYTYTGTNKAGATEQTTVTKTSTGVNYYGVLLQRADDPAGIAANTVLRVTVNGGTNNSSTSKSADSVIELHAGSKKAGGMIHVIEYDFYLEGAHKGSFKNPFELYAYDENGDKIMQPTPKDGNVTEAFTISRYTATAGYTGNIYFNNVVTEKTENAFLLGYGTRQTKDISTIASLDSHTWYKIRIIWDQSTGNIYYDVSFDGGESWYLAFNGERLAYDISDKTVDHLAININHYGYGAVFYFDNISYIVTDEILARPTALGNDAIEKPASAD